MYSAHRLGSFFSRTAWQWGQGGGSQGLSDVEGAARHDYSFGTNGFGVSEVQERKGADVTHWWAVGVRLGPAADGLLSQPPLLPRPSLCTSPLRKLLASSGAAGHVGSPTTMNTDGSLKPSVMAYQSSWIALNHCEGARRRRNRARVSFRGPGAPRWITVLAARFPIVALRPLV